MPGVCFDIERPVFVLAGPSCCTQITGGEGEGVVTHASDFTLDTSLGGGQGGAA